MEDLDSVIPLKNWTINLDVEASSSHYYRGDEDNASGLKLPGYFYLTQEQSITFLWEKNLETGANGTFFLDCKKYY